MQQTIKLAQDGPHQVLRLPEGFCFEGEEVTIRRDTVSGDIILSEPSQGLARVFEMIDALTQEERDAFVIPPRDRSPIRVPDLSE